MSLASVMRLILNVRDVDKVAGYAVLQTSRLLLVIQPTVIQL